MNDVVTYSGANRDEALAAAHADAARALEAGFVWLSAEWGTDGDHDTVAVTYAYQPPPVLVRTIVAADAQMANARYAQDATAMARAGYIPMTQSWAAGGQNAGAILAFGIAGLAFRGAGVLSVTYMYRPDMTGPPSAAIPPAPTPVNGPAWGQPR